MKKKIYCFNCDNEVTYENKKKLTEYNIHGEKFNIEETYAICSKCGNVIEECNTNEDLENVYNAYLKKYDLNLNSFVNIRKNFNLSQELFAKALGWEKKTINRYENKQSFPQREYLNVYARLNKNDMEIYNIIVPRKEELGDDYYKIINKIASKIDIKAINALLFLLNNNCLYKTQIMKNMFAIDFFSQKKNGHPITNLKYVHANYGPMIDDGDKFLSILIKNDYLDLTNNLDETFIFKTDKICDLSLFNDDEIQILKYVKKTLMGKSAKELTEWSHKFEGWCKTKPGKVIDYKYAKSLTFDL